MKRICKSDEREELEELTVHRQENPSGDWRTLKNENRDLYEKIRSQCIEDQGCLCGFCEIQLPDTPMGRRVEHFHPKSDKSPDHNWALDWNNMLAVCLGGCNQLVENTIRVLNLNCDRLNEERRKVLFSIEHEKKKARKRNQRPSTFLSSLAERYFSEKWPRFFTTRRILLGKYAEDYLQSISFNG